MVANIEQIFRPPAGTPAKPARLATRYNLKPTHKDVPRSGHLCRQAGFSTRHRFDAVGYPLQIRSGLAHVCGTPSICRCDDRAQQFAPAKVGRSRQNENKTSYSPPITTNCQVEALILQVSPSDPLKRPLHSHSSSRLQRMLVSVVVQVPAVPSRGGAGIA
jgi:hypothetical protein